MTQPPINLRPSVLIFEDDADLVSQWFEVLKANDLVPEHAPTLSAAEELCRMKQFDVIVSDIFIRGAHKNFVPEGGISFIHHLRAPASANLPEWCRQVPIIAVTGANIVNQFDVFKTLKPLKKVTFLRKPFTPDELVAQVLEVLP